ncbi:tail fiber assembly protein [[Erwinia] mediterraneensis]|uniref:tail fiber assembly protein n=1 Tax=[Erwinia] mediterraneensis TaxID=2161819 RepID=UPI001F1FA194|nr:tail fiber assembly protein [[Erwinia] mediterraneensis]
MSKVIIFVLNNDVMVMTPTPEEISGLSVNDAAKIGVPEGVRYWIVDYETLPTSYPQESWDINDETGAVFVDEVRLKKLQVAEADTQKEALIAAANAYINEQNWPSKLALGRLSDADKAKFNAWLDYIDAVTAVSTSTAPDITWPEKPAS